MPRSRNAEDSLYQDGYPHGLTEEDAGDDLPANGTADIDELLPTSVSVVPLEEHHCYTEAEASFSGVT